MDQHGDYGGSSYNNLLCINLAKKVVSAAEYYNPLERGSIIVLNTPLQRVVVKISLLHGMARCS